MANENDCVCPEESAQHIPQHRNAKDAISVLNKFFVGKHFPPSAASASTHYHQTLKAAALAQQTNNSAMDAIAELYINEVAFLDSSDAGTVRSFVAYLQQQHQ